MQNREVDLLLNRAISSMPRSTEIGEIECSTPGRRHRRNLTLWTGKITCNDNADILCAILNISDGGACVPIPDARPIPDSFGLTIDRSQTSYSCKVAWRSANRVESCLSPPRRKNRKRVSTKNTGQQMITLESLPDNIKRLVTLKLEIELLTTTCSRLRSGAKNLRPPGARYAGGRASRSVQFRPQHHGFRPRGRI